MKSRMEFLMCLLALAVVLGCRTITGGSEAPPVIVETPTVETGMPNPASVYCEEQGYKLEIRTDADGGQYGVCLFPDGSECEEWAFYRGECAPGGAEPAGTEIDCDGVSLRYTGDVARAVVCATFPEEVLMGDIGITPEHRGFRFIDYALQDTFHEPVIHIYPVAALEAGNEVGATIVGNLRAFLQQRPTQPEDIPFMPIWNAAQIIRTQIAFLDFENGSGVRFLSQYGQAFLPINNRELFYTFQGLTADGEYYVAAVLPISHPELPADGALPPDFDFDDAADYFADIEAQLDAQSDDSFMPSLTALDALISSLEVLP